LSFGELVDFLKTKEIAKFKLPESMLVLDDFPVSTFGKVSKKALSQKAEEAQRQAEEAQRQAEQAQRQAEEAQRQENANR
jgi:2,3-dihydroxybenzoate-AMP ligase